MTRTLGDDVDTLLDLLAMLPPFRGDLDGRGGWDPSVKTPAFWGRFVELTSDGRQADPAGWVSYMAGKLEPHVETPPERAVDAAEFASYCLMFFAVTTNAKACALLGGHFTPTLSMPDGDAELGRRWADDVVTVAWRIYRSVGVPSSTGVSLAPGRTLEPTAGIRTR